MAYGAWHASCHLLNPVMPELAPFKNGKLSGSQVHALIVEDDLTFREYLAELLKGKGFEVTAATDGVRGYELSQKNQYDVFIIDVRMPLVLGTELAQALKQERPA